MAFPHGDTDDFFRTPSEVPAAGPKVGSDGLPTDFSDAGDAEFATGPWVVDLDTGDVTTRVVGPGMCGPGGSADGGSL